MKKRLSVVILIIIIFTAIYSICYGASIDGAYQPNNYFADSHVLGLTMEGNQDFPQDFLEKWKNFLVENKFEFVYFPSNGLDLTFSNAEPFFTDLAEVSIEVDKSNEIESTLIRTDAIAVEDTWSELFFYKDKIDNYYSVYPNLAYRLNFVGSINKAHPILQRSSNPVLPLEAAKFLRGEWYIKLEEPDQVNLVSNFLKVNNVDNNSVLYKPSDIFRSLYITVTGSIWFQLIVVAIVTIILELINYRKMQKKENYIRYLLGATKLKDFTNSLRDFMLDILLALLIVALPVGIVVFMDWDRLQYYVNFVELELLGFALTIITLLAVFIIIYCIVDYIPESEVEK